VAFDRISHVDVPLGMGGNRALIFHDADGTAVVISMARGAASVRVVGRDLMEKTTNGVVTLTGGGLSNALAGLTADKITLTSTTLASGLVIATSGGAAAGTTLGSLTGSQPIGAIIAPGANLLGTMKLSGTGYARTTVLGDMAASSALEMDGAGTAAGVVISAGTIGANAQMTLACPLARLTAVDWTSGQLNGTRAQTILVTGRPKIGTTAAVTADFGADISLTGKDAAGVALYLLDVPGTFSGNLSASSGGGTPVYGAVRTILAGAWTEGIFQASDLSSLIVRGQVGTVTLHASHAITSLYAAGWTGGLVDAPTLTSLRIPGRLARGTTTAVTGDFGANVTSTSVAKAVIAGKITGNWTDHSITLLWVGGDMSGSTMSLGAAAGTATPALRTLVVGGTISNSTITSTTSIGTVTAGGMTGSKLLVGVNGTNLPTQASDFVTAHPGSIQSVLIRGLRKPDGTWAYSYSNSDIAAWNLGRITLSNIDTSSDTSTAFGVVGHSLTNYVRLQSGQLWTSSGGAVTGPSNAADAPLVVEHAGDFSVKLVPVPAAG
jgi:hypothetical protein